MLTQQWEYAILDLRYEPQKTLAELDDAGKDGWEAVGMSIAGSNLVILCKRPYQPEDTNGEDGGRTAAPTPPMNPDD